MIFRFAHDYIKSRLFKGKAIIVQGARQVGKTTLMQEFDKTYGKDVLWLDCDEIDIRIKLTNTTSTQLKSLIGNHKIVIIDEAQRVENVGITLKLITDKLKDVQLIVSGSSALELGDKLNETLTGRKYNIRMFPLSIAELSAHTSTLEESRMLEHRMIYGLYPDVVNHPGEETDILKELVNSYLYKDILMFKDIRKPHLLPKLLQALALQLGSEVSYNELSRMLEIDRETVERYIDLLEKMFIVFRLPCFSRNLRTEINKSKKIYFIDTGIRNALISNFNPLDLRQDKGALWENFLICERMKYLSLQSKQVNVYFWRTQLQQEIDYIEETDGILNTFEFKWGNKSFSLPKSFSNGYPNHTFTIINKENYQNFIIP